MSSTMLSHSLVLLLAGLVTAELDIEIDKKFKELPFSEFISYFNSLNLTYTIKDYSQQYQLLSSQEKLYGRFLYIPEVAHKRISDLPKNFDSRKQWPRCDSIRTINDQGDGCGSCWVFGSVDTASDRTCIHKNINVLLSQAEGTCFLDESVCSGGNPAIGFDFWLKTGLVTKQCQNYTTTKARGRCNTKCESPLMQFNKDKHFAKKIYRVASNSIREEIYMNGPVEASMKVYEDFQSYSSGIYERKFGIRKDWHSVRIIGYGTEDGVDYWLVANSWSTKFGEKGYFKIKRDIGLGLEDSVLTGLPKN